MLNPGKTRFLVLRRPNRDNPDSIKLSCRGSDILPCSSARYLGLIIDEHLTFRDQVDRVCTIVNQKIGAFRHGRRNLSKASRRIFFLSIIQSSLEYASTAYVHSLSQTLYNQLTTTSRTALKKVFSLDRQTPTSIVHSFADLYSFEQRINLKTFVFVYRCLNQLTSPLLQLLFTTRSSGQHTHATTRGQLSTALVLPRPKSRFGFHAISFLAADRWNSLPPDCYQANSPARFASLAKQHLGYPVKRH